MKHKTKKIISSALNIFKGNVKLFENEVRDSESMPGFPFPALSISSNGKIVWYNSALSKIFEGELLCQKNINDIIPEFKQDANDEKGQYPVYRFKSGGKSYNVLSHKVSSGKDDSELVSVYFIDTTDYETLREKYSDEKFAVMEIAFDNYEEVMQSLDEEASARISSSIDKLLTSVITSKGGIIKKTDRDRYFAVISQSGLRQIELTKFSILDDIRKTETGGNMAPTLSIGIGVDGNTAADCYSFARSALDMALGRGGDQVIIKDANNFKYFGGKTREVEKRTRVKARVVAMALRSLISGHDKIVIIGHKNEDIDCIGSALGIASVCRMFEKKAFIAIGDSDDTVKAVLKKAREQEIYKPLFIPSDKAIDYIDSKTLVIIVDTNTPSYMESPEILTATDRLVIIDHHRRSADFIQNATLVYHEPYASSTCEMVTEMLQYISDKNILSPIEAEALFAGIYLDTKYFTFKTGVRTLEAAAYLRRSGIDPIAVKQYFKSDFKTYTKRAELVQSAEIIKEHISIVVSTERCSPSLIAQAADELLNISGIDASFVICRANEGSIISGRSTGDINVQLILEAFGGGGHFSVAGAQVKDTEPDELKIRLIETIENYLSENTQKGK